MESCLVLNVRIAVTDMIEACSFVLNNSLSGKYICFSNVHTTVMAYEDIEYRNIQNFSAASFPDGKPLSVICRKKGYKNAKKVSGPDFMGEMFEKTHITGQTHFFYGATEEALEKLKNNLEHLYPGIRIAGVYSPPFRPLTQEEDERIIRMIQNCNPDFIWVGLGAPKQEQWMYNHRNLFNGVMLGVGAGFDFHAGTIKRAPKWMQNCGLEWLYRLSQDPKRLWKRYVVTNTKFLFLIEKELLQ